jgi:hypothetical protein
VATYLYPDTDLYPGDETWPGAVPQSLMQAHADARAARWERRERRIRPPLIRLWDGDWKLRGIVRDFITAEFQLLDNEPGVGILELPMTTPRGRKNPLAEWVLNFEDRKANVHVTADKDGIRWGGRIDDVDLLTEDDGTERLRLTFKHDLAELHHIRCWPNPFLPAEVQFPRLWFLFGPAKWAIKTTLFVNIMRLESSLWMLPDDPLDPSQWFNLNQSTWSMVVAPGSIAGDNSPLAVPFSRMKSAYDMSKRIMADGQLSWSARRYLDGDPPPWPGANLRHGCLVFDIVDKSGWTTETSFGGNLATGLVRAFTTIGSDGLTEGIDVIDDPTYPPEYQQDWMGTRPVAPWVVLRNGIGIQSSSNKWRPPTDVQVTVGGHSAPYVNETISAGIIAAGNLTAMIPGVPPVGGVLEAVLRPLFEDTLFAFQTWKSPARAQRLGWSHYHEHWPDAAGADRAYTLGAIMALRSGFWETREQVTHSVVISDSAPYLVGAQGQGHMDIGDRVAVTPKGIKSGKAYVDRITELTLGATRDGVAWKAQVGAREFQDPVVKAYEALLEITEMAQALGVA